MYKLVRNVNGELKSPIITTGPYCITYLPGEWVHAKIGRLFVFGSEMGARLFMLENALSGKLYEIWQCDTIAATKCVDMSSIIEDDGLLEYWRTQTPDPAAIIPYDTYLTNGVKLLVKVHDR